MSLRRSLRSLSHLVETLLVGPGIVSHELAHVLACRLTGITVTHGPVLDPFAEDAFVDHERVDTFPVDFGIAIAPLVLNTVLGVAAFTLAAVAPTPVLSVPCYWLGACFALTAFPSVGDTTTFSRTVRTLPRWTRPLGYALATPLRVFTRIPGANGAAGFVWIFVLLAASQSLLASITP
ncbi:MAG: hypothetical protein ABEI77_07355 [Halorientalis sp.]